MDLENLWNKIIIWLSGSGLQIFLILIGSFIVIRIFKMIANKIVEKAQDDDPDNDSEAEKRAKTLAKLFFNTSRVIIIILAMLMIIGEFGIDLGPLIAGAGIAGIAIGLGAKDLVSDLFAGFFILLEQQIRVGDIVKIGQVGGLVEKMSLRTTVLRDLTGTLHIIPNGKIDIVSNMTYEWSRAKVKFGIAYKEDLDKVIAIIEEVGKGLKTHEAIGKYVLEDPIVLGVDEFAESSIIISVIMKTSPRQQWAVERTYRKEVKKKFDELGIEIPFPQRVVKMKK